jgi:hypothetical protein
MKVDIAAKDIELIALNTVATPYVAAQESAPGSHARKP